MLRQFSLVPSLHEAELASTPQVRTRSCCGSRFTAQDGNSAEVCNQLGGCTMQSLLAAVILLANKFE